MLAGFILSLQNPVLKDGPMPKCQIIRVRGHHGLEIVRTSWLTVAAVCHAKPDLAAANRLWRPLFNDESDVLREGITTIRDGCAVA
jgi:hypothetical protein